MASRLSPGACTLMEHVEGHKVPGPAKAASVCARILNFAKLGIADEIISGCKAFYKHRRHGWIECKVTKVDYQGAAEAEGATYCVTAPQLDGEVETVRERLRISMPEEEEAKPPAAAEATESVDVD